MRARQRESEHSFRRIASVLVQNGLAHADTHELDVDWKSLYYVLFLKQPAVFTSYSVMRKRFRTLLRNTAFYLRLCASAKAPAAPPSRSFGELVTYLNEHKDKIVYIMLGRFSDAASAPQTQTQTKTPTQTQTKTKTQTQVDTVEAVDDADASYRRRFKQKLRSAVLQERSAAPVRRRGRLPKSQPTVSAASDRADAQQQQQAEERMM